MRGFFTLILLFSIDCFAKASENHTAVFPLATTDKGEVYVTFNDINQMKLMFAVFALSTAVGLIKWLLSFFTKTEEKRRKEIDTKLGNLEDSNSEILAELRELKIHFSNIKNSQVNSDDVRAIARNEIEYVDKLRSKR